MVMCAAWIYLPRKTFSQSQHMGKCYVNNVVFNKCISNEGGKNTQRQPEGKTAQRPFLLFQPVNVELDRLKAKPTGLDSHVKR